MEALERYMVPRKRGEHHKNCSVNLRLPGAGTCDCYALQSNAAFAGLDTLVAELERLRVRCDQQEQIIKDFCEMNEQARDDLAYLRTHWPRIADGDGDTSEDTIDGRLYWIREDLDTTEGRAALSLVEAEGQG